MTTFIQSNHSTRHVGAERFESAVGNAQHVGLGFSGTRGLTTLLLSAIAAAVMVVADQVMDSVAEGHVLVMWIALWTAAFVSLAVFAGTARNLATRMKVSLDGWSRAMASARADERLWAAAQTDPRVMADLQAAASRDDDMDTASPSMLATSVRARRLTRGYWSGSF